MLAITILGATFSGREAAMVVALIAVVVVASWILLRRGAVNPLRQRLGKLLKRRRALALGLGVGVLVLCAWAGATFPGTRAVVDGFRGGAPYACAREDPERPCSSPL